jgi:hypothetical protein
MQPNLPALRAGIVRFFRLAARAEQVAVALFLSPHMAAAHKLSIVRPIDTTKTPCSQQRVEDFLSSARRRDTERVKREPRNQNKMLGRAQLGVKGEMRRVFSLSGRRRCRTSIKTVAALKLKLTEDKDSSPNLHKLLFLSLL